MKQSKNFSMQFQEVLEESYVGDSRTGGSPAVWRKPNTTRTSPTRKGQNPPFSVYPATDGHQQMDGYTDMVTQDKDETNAPKRSPFPLETVEDQFEIGFVSLHNIRAMVKQTNDHPNLNQINKKELATIEQQLTKTIEFLKRIEQRLELIKI